MPEMLPHVRMMLNLQSGKSNTLHLVNVTSILMEAHQQLNVKELLHCEKDK
jgi:hypothetical protein